MDNFFGCDKIGNKVRDCPNVKGKDKEIGQASGSNDASKKNSFHGLRSRGERRLPLMWLTVC